MTRSNATAVVSGKINRVPASTTYRDVIDGSIILLPGNSLYWIFTPVSGSTANCNIDLVWWESLATT